MLKHTSTMEHKLSHLPAILITMAERRCDTKHIARCSISRATLEATGHRHWMTTHSISPRWPPERQSTIDDAKYPPLCWPFRWQWQGVSTILHRRRFMAFLKATKRRHRTSSCSDIPTRTCLPLILGVYFIVKSTKRAQVDI